MNAKKILPVLFLFITAISLAQNVGVGTNSPQFKLDIAGRTRLQYSTATGTPGIYFDGLTLPTRSFFGTLNDDHVGIWGVGTNWNFAMNVNNGNIGIGTTTPTYKLDLKGRMRIQNGTQSAGIWFDGTTLPVRSFIGTMDDTYVGLYGNAGAGWNFVMNVTNGNTGIGTTSPTSRLDVNGSFRLRHGTPVKGSVLTSNDANGNAVWARPVAFKGDGGLNSAQFPVPNLTWTKVFFNQSAAYNLGNHYHAVQSEFIVTEAGIYHFDAVLTITERCKKQSIRIRLNRNGVISTIGEIYNQGSTDIQDRVVIYSDPSIISVESLLQIGDKVWVECWVDLSQAAGNDTTLSNDPTQTYFQGQLIARI